MKQAKFVQELVATDPDTGLLIELAVYKHPNGGMFAMDSSYIVQCFGDDEKVIISDPLDENCEDLIELVED